MTLERSPLLVLFAVLLVLVGASAARADDFKLTQAESAGKFPERTFVLSLPKESLLSAGDVRVEENATPVPDLRVVRADEAAGRAFGVVLAIDSSESMHDEAIVGAMEAARAFAARRPERQSLGVMFFNHDASVALPLTADATKIDATLSSTPPLNQGTRLNDSTYEAIGLLHEAQVSAGSVIVLSDGADVGSTRSASEVAAAARRAHVRIFTVGLRSASYDSSTLRALAAAGNGRYTEATSADRLAAAFDDLAARLASEYLVSYRSLAPLGSNVSVAATVDGVPGRATTEYTAPKLAVPPADTKAVKAGWWTTSTAQLVAALLCALLLGSALYVVIRPRPVPVLDRINEFTNGKASVTQTKLSDRQMATVLTNAEKGLHRLRGWPAFALDMDVARIGITPMRFAAITLAAGASLGWVLIVVAGRPLPGLLAVLLALFGVRRWVAIQADRQRRQFADQLVDNLQVAVSAMRTGHSFAGALSVAVEDASEPARSELQRIIKDEQLGTPVDEAVNAVAHRMKSTELEHVGLVAALQRETGGNTAEVVERLIENIRGRTEIRLLISTLTAQGRLGGAIITALPVGIALVMSLLNPGYMDGLTESAGGRFALFLGACAVAAGWLIIRKIVDIKV